MSTETLTPVYETVEQKAARLAQLVREGGNGFAGKIEAVGKGLDKGINAVRGGLAWAKGKVDSFGALGKEKVQQFVGKIEGIWKKGEEKKEQLKFSAKDAMSRFATWREEQGTKVSETVVDTALTGVGLGFVAADKVAEGINRGKELFQQLKNQAVELGKSGLKKSADVVSKLWEGLNTEVALSPEKQESLRAILDGALIKVSGIRDSATEGLTRFKDYLSADSPRKQLEQSMAFVDSLEELDGPSRGILKQQYLQSYLEKASLPSLPEGAIDGLSVEQVLRLVDVADSAKEKRIPEENAQKALLAVAASFRVQSAK
jgi:hypothetical protein